MMALVLPPLLEKAFRMTHASFPHAALWRHPCCRGLRLAVTLFTVLFPAGPGIGLSAQSPDFLRACAFLKDCVFLHSLVSVFHWESIDVAAGSWNVFAWLIKLALQHVKKVL